MSKIAQIITKVVDFVYQPFSKVVSKELFRYAACGGSNLVLDWVLYFIFYNFVVGHEIVYLPFMIGESSFAMTPHIATLCIVFPITLFTGFWLNKNVTFTQSSLRGSKQLWRYIMIVAINLVINYVGLKLCVEVIGWYPTPSKIFITLVTVAVSYFGQKYYSFKK